MFQFFQPAKRRVPLLENKMLLSLVNPNWIYLISFQEDFIRLLLTPYSQYMTNLLSTRKTIGSTDSRFLNSRQLAGNVLDQAQIESICMKSVNPLIRMFRMLTKLNLGPSRTSCITLRWLSLRAKRQLVFYWMDFLNCTFFTTSSNTKAQLLSPNSARFMFFLNRVGTSLKFQMKTLPLSDNKASNSSSQDMSISLNSCFTLTIHLRDNSDCLMNPESSLFLHSTAWIILGDNRISSLLPLQNSAAMMFSSIISVDIFFQKSSFLLVVLRAQNTASLPVIAIKFPSPTFMTPLISTKRFLMVYTIYRLSAEQISILSLSQFKRQIAFRQVRYNCPLIGMILQPDYQYSMMWFKTPPFPRQKLRKVRKSNSQQLNAEDQVLSRMLSMRSLGCEKYEHKYKQLKHKYNNLLRVSEQLESQYKDVVRELADTHLEDMQALRNKHRVQKEKLRQNVRHLQNVLMQKDRWVKDQETRSRGNFDRVQSLERERTQLFKTVQGLKRDNLLLARQKQKLLFDSALELASVRGVLDKLELTLKQLELVKSALNSQREATSILKSELADIKSHMNSKSLEYTSLLKQREIKDRTICGMEKLISINQEVRQGSPKSIRESVPLPRRGRVVMQIQQMIESYKRSLKDY